MISGAPRSRGASVFGLRAASAQPPAMNQRVPLWAPRPILGRMRLACALLLALTTGCAFVLPAPWRAYRVEPDDLPPAITKVLDDRALTVEGWDPEAQRIETEWFQFNDGLGQSRERYVVSWEKNARDGTLIVYARHEAQDRDGVESPDWGSTYHDTDKEDALLDALTTELEAAYGAPAPAPEG